MDNRKNDDKNLNNGGNNFFNKNPILIFAIFAIVIDKRDDKKQAGYASRHLGNLDKSRG